MPIKLVENLNDLTRDFYNIINMNDKKFELLECVELPVSSEGSIKVTFKNKPGEAHDALHILSEGHIRCLGLAILLAKNVADNRGIIIFDDVVNAIDDEHRDGIRELLFKETRIKNKQIILTSHAEEFIKDLDNQFNDKEYGELVKRITFLRPSDARSVKVHSGESTFNYLVKAQQDIDSENKRDCLMNCRRALENITDSLWKKISKIYKTEITVKMGHPKYPPDLMTIVRGLRCFLESAKFPERNAYVEVVVVFKYLEGLESSHKSIWEYLNKGTHDETDRKEFDRAVVVNILETIRKVDSTIK